MAALAKRMIELAKKACAIAARIPPAAIARARNANLVRNGFNPKKTGIQCAVKPQAIGIGKPQIESIRNRLLNSDGKAGDWERESKKH